jgi:hypothetical protein
MTINCQDFETFIKTIAGLVREGLTFRADAGTGEIHLLGGH